MAQVEAKQNTPTRNAEVVYVGCKLPNGLRLRLFDKIEFHEPVMGGGTRKVDRYMVRPDAKEFVVAGPATPFGVKPQNIMAGNAVFTPVPKDFWDEWSSQNTRLDAVKNKMIFAAGTEQSIRSMSKEYRDISSNAGPMLQKDDPRTPKGRVKIEKAEADED